MNTDLLQFISSGQETNSVWLWFRQHYITSQKSDWIRTFTIFFQLHLVGGRSHHAGMETSL